MNSPLQTIARAVFIGVLSFLLAFGAYTLVRAAPAEIGGQPAQYFGVVTCGKHVLWVLTTDGKFYRFDDENTTRTQFEELQKQLQGIKGDLAEIKCPDVV